jgi:hypothetical protein
MTEAEWLECDDWALMQPHFGARATVRVLRLFACACCRTISHLFTEPQLIESVEVAERFADGSASDDELRSASDFAGAVSQSIKYANETDRSRTSIRRLRSNSQLTRSNIGTWNMQRVLRMRMRSGQ